jgi:hypothetical protein
MRRSVSARLSVCAVAATSLLLYGCSGEVQLYDPNQTPQDSVPTDVQKATVTLTFQIATEDSTVSQALGWPEGAVPDAEVTLSRTGSIEGLTGMTDAAGGITFEKLLPGSYRASALRLLTEEEKDLLAEPDQDVNALGGGAAFDVAAPETQRAISVAAGRPRSLVISELSDVFEPHAAGWYYYGHYLELYNNGDTTVYLDQVLIGTGFKSSYDYPKWPCVDYERWMNDPDGVWVTILYQFPGTGRQYPLAPGELAVIATDAIDHRGFGEGAVDLSGADFEFIGISDVDNPAAPNLVSVGPRTGDVLGHGLRFSANTDLLIVAEPVDLDAIPKEKAGALDYWIWRIPAEKVLDVATFRLTVNYSGYPPCPQLVHRSFDRQEAILLDSEDFYYSAQRRILYTLPGGRAVLQHTRTSARDFFKRTRNPGELP